MLLQPWVMELLGTVDLIALARTEQSARVPCAYAMMSQQVCCRLSNLRRYDLEVFPNMGQCVTTLLVSAAEVLSIYPQYACKQIACSIMGVHLNPRLERYLAQHYELSANCVLRADGFCLRCTEEVYPMVSAKSTDGSHSLRVDRQFTVH
jgi:hypothetical protein